MTAILPEKKRCQGTWLVWWLVKIPYQKMQILLALAGKSYCYKYSKYFIVTVQWFCGRDTEQPWHGTAEHTARIAGGIGNAIIRSGGKKFFLTVNIALIRLIKHKELINKPKQNVLSVTEMCFLYEKQNFLLSSFHPERWGAVGSVHFRSRRPLISCLAVFCGTEK